MSRLRICFLGSGEKPEVIQELLEGYSSFYRLVKGEYVFANSGEMEDDFHRNLRGSWEEEEEEKIEEEPMSHLIEKLDATVLGLVEALDADSEDLPRLLDEALQGSLWARQIGREDESEQQAHKEILEARANVIWSHTTPDVRKGHYAMGVGLEAGLAIDGMADVFDLAPVSCSS